MMLYAMILYGMMLCGMHVSVRAVVHVTVATLYSVGR
jgi:hypothetical protein